MPFIYNIKRAYCTQKLTFTYTFYLLAVYRFSKMLFYLLSKAIAAVIVLLWNFFAKKLMYRKKPNKE